MPDFVANNLATDARFIDRPQLIPVNAGSCHPVVGVGVAAVG